MIETVLDKVVAFIKESRYSKLIFIDIETVSFVSIYDSDFFRLQPKSGFFRLL